MSSQELLKSVSEKLSKRKHPALKAGQTVKVHQRIKEGTKERVQIFEGLIIRINAGNDVSKTFTVRKLVEGIGVEKIFPVLSTTIEKIEILKEAKVRRAKLYYMRNLSGKSARLREDMVKAMTGDSDAIPEEVKEELIQEAVEAQAAAEEQVDEEIAQIAAEEAASEETDSDETEEETKA